MIDNFKPALAKTLVYEGGWSDNPKDPGGATMKGIILSTYRTYKPGATKRDLLLIPDAMVEHIYKVSYWDNILGDKLPSGVSAVAFDYAVNSGLRRALAALTDASKSHPTDPAAQVAFICDHRLMFLQGLPTFHTFGKGWTNRVNDLKAFGLGLAHKQSQAALPKGVK